jgi:hypothetical protein
MKILVLIAFYRDYDTVFPLLDELRGCKEHDFELRDAQGADIHSLRNALVNNNKSQEKFQDPLPNYDFVLWLDSDNYGSIDDILPSIAMDKYIVCLPSLEHKSETRYICGMFGKIPGNKGFTFDTNKKGKYKIDWCSVGGTLMKTSIFPKIEYPWFRGTMIEDGTRQSQTSEGIGFFLNAKNHGFDVWCNFDKPLGHKKRKESDFNRYGKTKHKGDEDMGSLETELGYKFNKGQINLVIKGLSNMPFKESCDLIFNIQKQHKELTTPKVEKIE